MLNEPDSSELEGLMNQYEPDHTYWVLVENKEQQDESANQD